MVLLVYRNATEFCVFLSYILQFCQTKLISSSSVSFSVCVFFGIFNIQDHVICNDSKFYFFLSNLDAFYFSVLPNCFGKNF